jgi:hypothetical protein
MRDLHGMCLASGPHLHLIEFDNTSASILEAFIQIFLRDDHAHPRCECLYLEAPVSYLSEEFLSEADLVKRIQMVPFVYFLIDSTRELLARVDVVLELLPIELESSGKSSRFLVKQFQRGLNEEEMHLLLKDINLTVRKLVLLDSIAHGLLLLLFEYHCHLLCGDTPTPTFLLSLSHLLFLLVIEFALRLHLFGLLIIPLSVNLPLYLLVVLLNNFLQRILVREGDK